MEAAKCKLCGSKHWNTEPHQFEVKARPQPSLAVKATVKKSALHGSITVALRNVTTKQERWRERNAGAYKKHRSEYMRKYRQGKKVAKNT